MVKDSGTSANGGTQAHLARFVTVDVPPSYQGVGQALRAAYRTDMSVMPEDMTALLDMLNKH